MWWNNVETKPGTGYPTKWEDQEIYKAVGKKRDSVRLKEQEIKRIKEYFSQSLYAHTRGLYVPWAYKYQDLFTGTGRR